MFEDIEGLDPEVKAKIEAKIATEFVARQEFEAVAAKKEELLNEAKNAKRIKAEAEAEAERIRLEAAAQSGDIESLRKSYEEKLQALSGQINSFHEEKKRGQIGSVAGEFVNTHVVDDSFVREAMQQEFAKRLDLREGQVVVLDASGNLTALTVDDLKQEFLNNSKYARQLVGSKANGGGAGQSGKPAPSTKKSLDAIPLNDKEARIAAIKAKLAR